MFFQSCFYKPTRNNPLLRATNSQSQVAKLMRATWHEPRDFQRYGRYKPEPFGSIRQVKYLIIELLLLLFSSAANVQAPASL